MFSYHGHATWMPDRRRGYVHRQRGLQKSDSNMADAYRSKQREPEVAFTRDMQRLMIDTARVAAAHINAITHGIGCEPTHVHVLVSWRTTRSWMSMRKSMRYALTKALNERFGRREWFSDSPSRKHVNGYAHFDYLILEYLPEHKGESWVREEDLVAAQKRKTGAA
jgi:REP element-mobilizing transposase RayT